MYAICIEASHAKGMGHLYRMISFAEFLDANSEKYLFLINDNQKTKDILESKGINFEIVDLLDNASDWECQIIKKYNISYWINDRLDTTGDHAKRVKSNSTKLITLDDLGSGAKQSDINICGLFFHNINLEGKKVLSGVEYLILNSEIDRHKRVRTEIKNILVTLGGSDTYGVSIDILKILKKNNTPATIHLGPSFEHRAELLAELDSRYKIIEALPSLIAAFEEYDLAITGGGVTPFEANASGLPCFIVANELFEIPNGEFLEGLGSSRFLGFYKNINSMVFDSLHKLNITEMSKSGIDKITTSASQKIYEEIVRI